MVEFRLKNAAAGVCLLGLGACTPVYTGQVTYDNAERHTWRAAAERGDAEAQYRLGQAYCCGKGYYSTAEALKWWCKATAQGHEQARRRLRERLGVGYPESCPTPAQ